MSSALDKAIARLMQGRPDEARRSARKVLEQDPDHPQALLLLAETYRRMGDDKGAARADARVLECQPGWTPAHLASVVGALYEEHARPAEAAERYRHALALDPGFAEARERFVRLLFRERQLDELKQVCREGMRRFPEAALYPERLAYAAWHLGRNGEALAGIAQAMALAATDSERQDIGASQAFVLLALGRYAEGWRAFRWRPSRARLREQGVPLMPDPERLATLASPARVLIRAEQGLGDELFFLRFAAALRERGHSLNFVDLYRDEGDKGLCSLLPPYIQPVAVDAPYTIASGDLPLATGCEFAPPLEFAVDIERRKRWARELLEFGPPPYIGVTWRAGVLPEDPKPQRYFVKALPVEALARAIAPANLRVVILQRRPDRVEMQRFEQALGRKARDLSAVNDNLCDALALLSLLDDYVGVSNTNMHLRAGLRGRTARVLVDMPPEWRWGLDADVSPWFPGFMVYRRKFRDEWAGVLGQLQQDLLKLHAASQ